MDKEWSKLYNFITKSRQVVLSTHMSPDPDGLGSEVAFYYYLHGLNKKCKIINISPIENHYRVVDPEGIVEHYNPRLHDDWISNSDLAIVFDIGNYRRLGVIADHINDKSIYSISIDHHPSNDKFFKFKILDTSAPATGYMVWKFFKYLNIESFDKKIAIALYAALITDTGSFRYNSTNSDTHMMAANLLDNGVKPYDVYSAIYEQRTKPQIKLLNAALSKIEYSKCNEFAWVVLDNNVFLSTNTKSSDVEGLADFLRSIKNVEVAFIMIQIQKGNIRLSFRSRGKYIINDIAQSFGGGGHKLAAGATVKNMSFIEIKEKILEQLKKKKEEYVN